MTPSTAFCIGFVLGGILGFVGGVAVIAAYHDEPRVRGVQDQSRDRLRVTLSRGGVQ